MACFHPLTAYKVVGGGVTFSNKGSSATKLQLPCGQCIGCRVARSRAWALRCVHEASMHERNSFITLTYSPSQLPESGSLVVKHWQDFAKRLRHRLGSFRFFHCGEYGDINLRPHYHAAIFGQDFAGDRLFLRKSGGNELYRSKVLEEAWGKGFCTVGNLTYESAAYVARYVMKKATGPLAQERYMRYNDNGEYWFVKPEYVTMSRRPGIGCKWFEEFGDDVFPEDEVVYNGRRFRPPRYYDNKLDDVELENIKARRRESISRRRSELTPDRLVVREKVAMSRIKRLSRVL